MAQETEKKEKNRAEYNLKIQLTETHTQTGEDVTSRFITCCSDFILSQLQV